MPADPTPVTDGLVAWFRSDLNVVSSGNLVNVWGGVCECYPNAVSIGSTQPVLSDSSFGSYPGLTFDGAQSLQIQAGALAQDSFTIFILGRATGDRVAGGYGASGQRLLLSQSGDGNNAWPSISAGQTSIGIYEYGPTNAARADYSGETGDTKVLCPLVVCYENRQLSIWLRSELVYQDTATPAYALWLAHYLGGTGDADSGFIGALAEILFYNRAFTDSEREAVESYLQNRYGCMPSSSDSGEASDSSDSSSSESSSWSSSDSSDSSSSESSDSSDSTFEITTTELPDGTVDEPYLDESGSTVYVDATGGTPPYTWSASDFPDGLDMSEDGSISGTPTAEGDYEAYVQVQDNDSPPKTDSKKVPIAVKKNVQCDPTWNAGPPWFFGRQHRYDGFFIRVRGRRRFRPGNMPGEGNSEDPKNFWSQVRFEYSDRRPPSDWMGCFPSVLLNATLKNYDDAFADPQDPADFIPNWLNSAPGGK